MKNFEALRYLKRWKYLILVVALLGAVLVYRYAATHQVYTAQTVLRYSNEEAAGGMTPSGAKIDTSEIYSANVITRVIEDLKLTGGADAIRSNCKVTPIIPEDEEQRKKALLDEGKEYEYYPTDYIVTFAVDSQYSQSYAADVLDSICKNYFIGYGEKYINQTLLPNNASNVASGQYDYIETAEILRSSANEIYSYLYNKKEKYPYFRSAETGYTFLDLYEQYRELLDYQVPRLSSEILNQKISKEREVLIKDYNNKINSFNLDIQNLDEKINPLYELMLNYSGKSKEGIQYHYGKGADENGKTDSYILKDVYEDEDEVKANTQTTYDGLINEYVKLAVMKERTLVDRQHKQNLLSTFTDPNVTTGDTEEIEAIEQKTAKLVEELDASYQKVVRTVDEFNQYLGAANISMLNSIHTTEKINIKLYLLLALAVFLIGGCLGAIALGRAEDFVEYLIYTDRKTGLPNRSRCDIQIAQYEDKPLRDTFCFLLIRLDALKSINQRFGRNAGDALLQEFGKVLKELSRGYGFVGYNGSDQFICFFEECTEHKAVNYIENLNNYVNHGRNSRPDRDLTFSYAVEGTTETGKYTIRDLISMAYRDINLPDGPDGQGSPRQNNGICRSGGTPREEEKSAPEPDREDSEGAKQPI